LIPLASTGCCRIGAKEADHPFKTEVTDDHFLVLGPAVSIRLPYILMPPLMNNHGNYIVSLGNVCRWLATKAEETGVEIYPDFAATEVLYNDQRAVIEAATGAWPVQGWRRIIGVSRQTLIPAGAIDIAVRAAMSCRAHQSSRNFH